MTPPQRPRPSPSRKPAPAGPLVSVIVPSYNHARFIEACLDSVAAVQGLRLELLVVDDGSTDGTADVARRWLARNGARFERAAVERQANAGVCPTLNRLVAMARGDLVAPLASDDALLPGGLERRAAFLEAHPGHVAVFSDAAVIDGAGATTHASALRDLHGANLAALRDDRTRVAEVVLRWTLVGGTFLVRRGYFDAQGPEPWGRARSAEDRDFFLRLAAHGPVGYVEPPTSAYRLHGANVSRDPRRQADILRDLAEADLRHAGRFPFAVRSLLRMTGRSRALKARAKAARHPGLHWATWGRLPVAAALAAARAAHDARAALAARGKSNGTGLPDRR